MLNVGFGFLIFVAGLPLAELLLAWPQKLGLDSGTRDGALSCEAGPALEAGLFAGCRLMAGVDVLVRNEDFLAAAGRES